VQALIWIRGADWLERRLRRNYGCPIALSRDADLLRLSSLKIVFHHAARRAQGSCRTGASLRYGWDAPHVSARPHKYPQASADSCGGLQSRACPAPPDRQRHAGLQDRPAIVIPTLLMLLGAPRRWLVAISAWHPLMSAVRWFPSPITNHRLLLSGDHLHHGLLEEGIT
jgi:hypothetical protein